MASNVRDGAFPRFEADRATYAELLDVLNGRKAGEDRGRVIAVVGAGCSLREGYPTWDTVVSELAQLAGRDAPSGYSLEEKAEWLRSKTPEESYHSYLMHRFRPRTPGYSNEHWLLWQLPIRDYLTTNYDTCLEQAYVSIFGRFPHTLSHEDTTALRALFQNYGAQHEPSVVHLHGLYRRPERVLLTQTDLQKHYKSERGRLVQDLLFHAFAPYAILFVGYSFRDELSRVPERMAKQLAAGNAGRSYAILPYYEQRHGDDAAQRDWYLDRYGVKALFYTPVGASGLAEDHSERAQVLQQLVADLWAADIRRVHVRPRPDPDGYADTRIAYRCPPRKGGQRLGGRHAALLLFDTLEAAGLGPLYELRVPPDVTEEDRHKTLYLTDAPMENELTAQTLWELPKHVVGLTTRFSPDRPGADGGQRHTLSFAIEGSSAEVGSERSGDPDYGVLIRAPNPFSPKHHNVFVMAGVHRWGTQGAALAAVSPRVLKEILSHRALRGCPDEHLYFEALLRVPANPILTARDVELVGVNRLYPRQLVPPLVGTHGMSARTYWALLDGRSDDLGLDAVDFDLTMKCPMKCPDCIERKAAESARRIGEPEFSVERVVVLLDQLRQIGAKDVRFYGGEPTYHPQFPLIARLAAGMGFELRVMTSGSGLRDASVRAALASCGAALQEVRVSLDAADPAVHTLMRGGKAHYDEIVCGVGDLAACGVPVTVSHLLTGANWRQTVDVAARAKHVMRARALEIRPATGIHGVGLLFPKSPSSQEWKALAEDVGRTLSLQDERFEVRIPDWFRRYILSEGNDGTALRPPKTYDTCYAAAARCVISPPEPGTVSLCAYRRYEPGFSMQLQPGQTLGEWLAEQRPRLLSEIRPETQCVEVICNRHDLNRSLHGERQSGRRRAGPPA